MRDRDSWNGELPVGGYVVEPDQIDVLALSVLRDLQEIDHTFESRLARQIWSDIRETDRQNRIHLDRTLFHAVAVADLDVRTHPYPDAARDLAATNALPQALGKDHLERHFLFVLAEDGPHNLVSQEDIQHAPRHDRRAVLRDSDVITAGLAQHVDQPQHGEAASRVMAPEEDRRLRTSTGDREPRGVGKRHQVILHCGCRSQARMSRDQVIPQPGIEHDAPIAAGVPGRVRANDDKCGLLHRSP